jgi:CO dehydrogenase/acetyl-CoA synthase delta subunit
MSFREVITNTKYAAFQNSSFMIWARVVSAKNTVDHRYTSYLQSDRRLVQSLFKYLLMVAIQYNSIELTNTQYHCDYTSAHAGHVML